MRVALNARILSAKQLRGWSRYTASLIKALSFLDLEILLMTDRDLNEDLLDGADKKRIKVVQRKASNYLLWEQLVLPRLCQEQSVDVLHCPINYGLPVLGGFKKVLTLHDAIESSFYGDLSYSLRERVQRMYLKSIYYSSRRSADAIITVSESARRDITSYYGVPSSSMDVIYEGADEVFQNRQDLKLDPSKREAFFFYAGGYEERKNIPLLIEAFSKITSPSVRLVLAGGGSQSEVTKSWINSHGVAPRVDTLGWVSDERLAGLYRDCLAFVYPSFAEGFGLQAVEAMSCGAPVLAARSGSLPEVIGWEETLFDPHSVSSLVSIMKKILNNEARDKAIAHSLARSQSFSWEKAAKKHYNLYGRLLKVS